MQYIQENNISKYQTKVNYDITYNITKCHTIYQNKDVILKLDDINSDKIIEYCLNNGYNESYDNIQYLYFNDYVKCIYDNKLSYHKEINIDEHLEHDYMDYIKLKSDVSKFKFPSLINYDVVITRTVHSFNKTFKVHHELFDKNTNDASINIELFNNKILISVFIGNNNYKCIINNDINNELIQLCKLINIDIKKDYIVNRFDTIIKNY